MAKPWNEPRPSKACGICGSITVAATCPNPYCGKPQPKPDPKNMKPGRK